ncbi:hypothetical protein AB0903_12295 [Streptomyces sp. NPDC048389]|uniref:hypothetical protein n=1 Tax=Streptomyces sp. NPDC048389 TaxID=3154622 RepID=UPI003455CDE9
MDPPRNERTGLYRPRAPKRVPRSFPDEECNEIFARLPPHRDRSLVAFCISTGARAGELLSHLAGRCRLAAGDQAMASRARPEGRLAHASGGPGPDDADQC